MMVVREVILAGRKFAQHERSCPMCAAPMRLVLTRLRMPFYGCTQHHKTGCRGYWPAEPDGAPAVDAPPDAETRMARHTAHLLFDRLWQEHGMSREAAYKWLGAVTGLPRERAHIRFLDKAQCQLVIDRSAAIVARDPAVKCGSCGAGAGAVVNELVEAVVDFLEASDEGTNTGPARQRLRAAVVRIDRVK